MTSLEHALERSVLICATRRTVFSYFTDNRRFADWWGEGSSIEPRPEPLPPLPEGSRFTTKRKVALGVGAAGVIAVGVGIRYWNTAQSRRDDAAQLCPSTSCSVADAARANDVNDDARHKALVGNIAFGGGLAAAIAGGMLWYAGTF